MARFGTLRILYWPTLLLGTVGAMKWQKCLTSNFTHLSPVWYDLKSKGLNLALEGRHNADVGWISELKVKRRCLGIIKALSFIKPLGQAMHAVSSKRMNEQCLQLIYVIGPLHSEKLQEHDFSSKDLESLSNDVDGFSIMTYDFSSPQILGPNAPLNWIHYTLKLLLGPIDSNMARHKIFLGINFYGNDFMFSGGDGPITGRDYLALLKQHKPVFLWETTSEEHYFLYSDNNHNEHAVFYPSLMSISIRLAEAHCGESESLYGKLAKDSIISSIFCNYYLFLL